MSEVLKIMVTKDEVFYNCEYECKTSKYNNFNENYELIDYLIKNNIEPLEVHENLIDAFEIEMKDWIELYNDDGSACGFPYSDIEDLKALIKKMKLCKKLNNDTNYHECKNCGDVVNGTNEDQLCEFCKNKYGYSTYSVLVAMEF